MKMKVVIDNQTYQVDIEDIHARPVIALVEGERYEVWLETEETVSNSPTGAPAFSIPAPSQETPQQTSKPQTGSEKNVTAPLPGVIVAILVNPGDMISRGQELCTLEAMKMKNAIRANREGTIASIKVNVGDQVGHGQVLLTFTD
jgi:biotin carboxyl carrier protein